MPILPVIDLLGCSVVRAVAGRRAEYRPLMHSRIVDSHAPLDVAAALKRHFGFSSLYLADLNAIGGLPPALDLYRALQTEGFRLWVDAGLRDEADAAALLEAGIDTVVAGLESLDSPAVLQRLVQTVGSGRLVFSLDLKEGRPVSRGDAWPTDPWDVAMLALDAGLQRLLVLDLAAVGMGEGCRTEALCRRLRRRDVLDEALELTTGGGVRTIADVLRLYKHGVDHVLVASALHDGGIAPGATA
jgi:HisA/HisF family protein